MSKHDDLLTIVTPEGDVKASKGFLNMMCLAFFALEKEYSNDGYKASAESALNIAREISAALRETGYYDDMEEE